jgi:hypothetical protein
MIKLWRCADNGEMRSPLCHRRRYNSTRVSGENLLGSNRSVEMKSTARRVYPSRKCVQRKLQRRVGADIKTYGPYYLWTRKIKGKTVTVALTEDQARIIRQAIKRNRELERRIDLLRSLSEQIITEVSHSVARRKRKPKT